MEYFFAKKDKLKFIKNEFKKYVLIILFVFQSYESCC